MVDNVKNLCDVILMISKYNNHLVGHSPGNQGTQGKVRENNFLTKKSGKFIKNCKVREKSRKDEIVLS